MVRLVFTADNHLNKYYAKMTPEQLNYRRRRLREAWAETVDYAIRHGANFYLHGGDLFDSPNPRPTEMIWVGRHFDRLREHGIPVYAIGGNHDIPKVAGEGATPQRLYDVLRVARVFGNPTQVEWEVHEVDGMRIAIGGLPPDPRLGPDDDPLENIDVTPPADANHAVLMMHYGVEGHIIGSADEAIISKQRIADMRGIDLLLVGHVHERRVVYIGDVCVALCGPTERMNFGELAVKPGFVEAVFSGGDVKAEHRDTDAQRMHRATLRTTDIPTDDPATALKDFVRTVSHEDQLLQVRLEGPLDLDVFRRIPWHEVRSLGADLNFFFDLDRHRVHLRHEANLPVGEGHERVSPRAEIEAVAQAWMEETTDPEERDLMLEALDLTLRHYGGEA